MKNKKNRGATSAGVFYIRAYNNSESFIGKSASLLSHFLSLNGDIDVNQPLKNKYAALINLYIFIEPNVERQM